jgi:HAMP domain-containing protein
VTRRPRGLAARLLTAQLLVIAAGAVTLVLAALAAGPPLFRAHVRMALGTVSPALERHLDDAFAAAAGIALGTGAAFAAVTAVAVSLLITRRLSRPLRDLSGAAAAVAAGDHAARIRAPWPPGNSARGLPSYSPCMHTADLTAGVAAQPAPGGMPADCGTRC